MPSQPVPSVSVVMPAYNAARYLREAIDSILRQTYTDFEFIIINDGSTDDTRAIIQSYDDPRIVYLENETNSGICVTLNKGLDAARGRYIARMDADDISLPERLAVQVQYMDTHPEIGVCGTSIEVFYTDSGTAPIINFDTKPRICKANLIFSATLAHPTAIIRKSVLDDNNLRYDDYYRGMEDHHLWWRVSKYSDISNIPTVLLRYRQHDAQVTKQSTDMEFRSRLRAFILHRVTDLGTILNSDEINAFYLYHEQVEGYDDTSLKNFISACQKILKSIRKKKVKYYAEQKIVFSRAISFCLDKSNFNKSASIRHHLKALSKGAMNLMWLTKRIGHLVFNSSPANNPIIAKKNEYPIKKRVAVLMYYMNCGGVESALISLLNKFNYKEFTIDLYLLEAKGEFLERINKQVNIIDLSTILNPVQTKLIKSENIHETFRFSCKNKYIFKALKAVLLYALFKSKKTEFPAFRTALWSTKITDVNYDLILDFHGYASFTTFLGAYVLSGNNKMTWCHSQNIAFDKALMCIKEYDRMYTVSSEMKSLPFLRGVKIPIDVFHNFIDAEHILSNAKVGDRIHEKKDIINLLSIGRLSLEKGYDIAIQVAKILRDKGLNFKWYFCGDGDEREHLVTMVKSNHLEENIVFLGFQSNPYGYLSSCDIYVQPSRWEGYAVTLMEAKALNKIIVTTKVSGAEEAVNHGFDGYICNIDPYDLALCLEILITDKQLLLKMGENAKSRHFSQDARERQLKSLLNSL